MTKEKDETAALLAHYGATEAEGVHDDFEVTCNGEKVTMGELRGTKKAAPKSKKKK